MSLCRQMQGAPARGGWCGGGGTEFFWVWSCVSLQASHQASQTLQSPRPWSRAGAGQAGAASCPSPTWPSWAPQPQRRGAGGGHRAGPLAHGQVKASCPRPDGATCVMEGKVELESFTLVWQVHSIDPAVIKTEEIYLNWTLFYLFLPQQFSAT